MSRRQNRLEQEARRKAATYKTGQIENRQDLFNAFERVFGKARWGVAQMMDSDGAVLLVGMAQQFGKATVFCTPECFHPEGGKGFAVLIPGQPAEWFALNELEHALPMVKMNAAPSETALVN